MPKKKEATYSTETYPKLDNDLVANAAAVLEQYRQSIIGRDPLPLEWLFDSLRDGEVKDLAYYSGDLRDNEAEHEAAIERAGGPFDASYNPPPQIIGAESGEANPGEPEEVVEEAPADEPTTSDLAAQANVGHEGQPHEAAAEAEEPEDDGA